MDGSIDGRIDAWMAAGWLGGDMDGTKKHTRIGSCLHRYTCIKEKTSISVCIYRHIHTMLTLAQPPQDLAREALKVNLNYVKLTPS